MTAVGIVVFRKSYNFVISRVSEFCSFDVSRVFKFIPNFDETVFV